MAKKGTTFDLLSYQMPLSPEEHDVGPSLKSEIIFIEKDDFMSRALLVESFEGWDRE